MILLCCSSFGQPSNGTTQPLYNGRAREGLPVTSALVLLGAVTFTLMAAYQWAGRLGLWNAGPDGQVRHSVPHSPCSSGWFGFSVSNIELAVIEQREFELPADRAEVGLRKEQLGRPLPRT